jgi:hypothetical protein
MQCSAKMPPYHREDERANRRGHAAKERSGTPGEGVVHPAGVNHRPIKMILHHFLEAESLKAKTKPASDGALSRGGLRGRVCLPRAEAY